MLISKRGCLLVRPMLACVAVSALAGCLRPEPPTAEQYRHGLVYVFPGVEGAPESMTPPCRGIRHAGYRGALKVYDWNRPVVLGTFANLMDLRRNLEEARRVAEEITRYRRAHPNAPIDLVGYSGGGGLAVLVAEALPADIRLRYVILCQAAISPRYDLTAVLSRVDRKLINYYSPIDVVFLGAGTTLFGTIDREYTVSAGRSGFVDPPNVAHPKLAEKLEQRGWTKRMVSSWHVGLHFGMLTYEWNRDYIGPILAQPWKLPGNDRYRPPPFEPPPVFEPPPSENLPATAGMEFAAPPPVNHVQAAPPPDDSPCLEHPRREAAEGPVIRY